MNEKKTFGILTASMETPKFTPDEMCRIETSLKKWFDVHLAPGVAYPEELRKPIETKDPVPGVLRWQDGTASSADYAWIDIYESDGTYFVVVDVGGVECQGGKYISSEPDVYHPESLLDVVVLGSEFGWDPTSLGDFHQGLLRGEEGYRRGCSFGIYSRPAEELIKEIDLCSSFIPGSGTF